MAGIAFENVSKHYEEAAGKKLTVLKDMSFEVKAGKLVAIIGPSESGKSTLLSIAGALLEASEGNVHINGRI